MKQSFSNRLMKVSQRSSLDACAANCLWMFLQVMGLLPVQKELLKSLRLDELVKTKLKSHSVRGIRQAAGTREWRPYALLSHHAHVSIIWSASSRNCRHTHISQHAVLASSLLYLLFFAFHFVRYWDVNPAIPREFATSQPQYKHDCLADQLMAKWGINHSVEEPKQATTAAKAATAKPAKEEYDEQYQQELEILKQERAEVWKGPVF